ncbi:TolC family protein [Microbulbifer sp. TRSA007]|uniref:TolC family protein n=1 Tax=Microbulbifer sp. TRSA007 TaxID=3243384 RepID=UPI004039DFA2
MDFFSTLSLSVIGRTSFRFLLTTALLMSAQATSAQRGEVLTLPEAIQKTLAQNPQIAVFPLQQWALDGAEFTAGLRPAWDFGFEAEYAVYGDDGSSSSSSSSSSGSPGRPGPPSDDDDDDDKELELTASLSSVIELGGKRQARIDVVNAQRDLLIADEQATALDVLAEVVRGYAQVLAAAELLILEKEKVSLAQEALDAVTTRVNAAASPIAERMRAESALANAILAAEAQERMLSYYKYALSALWGQPTQDFAVDSSVLFRFEPNASFDVLYERAQENPSIARFASEERLRASHLHLTQAKSTPDIGWYAGYRNDKEDDENAVVVGFNVPLFTGRRNRGKEISAMAELEQVQLDREAALLKLYPQLFLAVTSREQALAIVDEMQNTVIPTLRKALSEVDRAYRRGRYSYVELISAREELLDAERSRIVAARSVHVYGAEIERLTARPLGVVVVESSR